jgi:hypothetical protein
MNHAAQTLIMVVSYWEYVAFLPGLFIAVLVHRLILRKD